MRIAFLFFAVWLLLLGCSDDLRSSHENRMAAEEAIKGGWIPAVLPESATAIQESHNLDLNTGYGTFRFSRKDAQLFRDALSPFKPAETSWLPVSKARYEKRGFHFYSHGEFIVAVNWKDSRSEFWLFHRREVDQSLRN